MVAEGRVSSPLTQVVEAGEFPVEVDLARGFATMRQLPPTFGPEIADRDGVAAGGGLGVADLHPDLPPQLVSTGLPHLLVPVRDEGTLRRAHRNDEALRAAVEALRAGLYLPVRPDGPGRDRKAVRRRPGHRGGPGHRLGRRAAGVYLAARGVAGMPGKLAIRQGEQVGRPSLLHVEVQPEGDSWSVRVGGGVAIVGAGSFRI
jgi:trans-2,3-dihydro-3-hydroxyanthranilate isomerase